MFNLKCLLYADSSCAGIIFFNFPVPYFTTVAAFFILWSNIFNQRIFANFLH